MSYLLLGAGIFGFMYYKRRSIAYQTLKAYTILESKYKEFTKSNNVKIMKELDICNEDDEPITKLIKFSYQGKVYQQFINNDEEPFFADKDNLELLHNYKSPILAITVNIYHNNEIIDNDYDITNYFNSFILPKCNIEMNEDNVSLWNYLFKLELNKKYELPISIEWTIIDNQVRLFKSKNIKLENNQEGLFINSL